VVEVWQWLGQIEVVLEPSRHATVLVADGVGDRPVEFPLLEVGPLVAVFVAEKRVLEAAAEASAQVGDRGGAGDGVVEVPDDLGIGCVLGDPADVVGVFASDLGSSEGGGDDVQVPCLEGRCRPEAPGTSAYGRDRWDGSRPSRWLPRQRFPRWPAESGGRRLKDSFGSVLVVGPLGQWLWSEGDVAAGIDTP
jgi:hypothetical protein